MVGHCLRSQVGNCLDFRKHFLREGVSTSHCDVGHINNKPPPVRDTIGSEAKSY